MPNFEITAEYLSNFQGVSLYRNGWVTLLEFCTFLGNCISVDIKTPYICNILEQYSYDIAFIWRLNRIFDSLLWRLFYLNSKSNQPIL